MNSAKYLIAFGLLLFLPGNSLAQFADDQQDGEALYSGIEGYWVGLDVCEGKAYAEFIELRNESGRIKGTYWWLGTSAGATEIDVLNNGAEYVFDAVDPDVLDFDYSFQNGNLVGRGRGYNCLSQLWRVSAERFLELKGDEN